ncbi:T9SS type A sorting domain-containing protein [candidate division KSB1 bacterium]|nr:T9SS type A sorting domain-containing protein [candidate division KSB1 bacterium]
MIKAIARISLIVVLLSFQVTILTAKQLAFPGAEGYGRFSTGGRDGQVIAVTNLNDSGPGSLREAIDTSGPRTIVFRVAGNIILKSQLTIDNDNVTIAGQTAPGDGICIRDYDVAVKASNVIIRYLRFRLGDVNKLEEDAITGRNEADIIIDHCSMSWSVDETASFYDNERFTMQWCLISESLYQSAHVKGNHGYGGIWGGKGASFHHNLLAHHSSRNPRFNGSRYHGQPELEIVDHRNNVIYNWGGNSAYGGEAGNQNVIANYYKYGPATKSSVRNRIVQPSDGWGKWYVVDNYVYGYPNITEDNWAGGVQGGYATSGRVDQPFSFQPVVTHSAEIAYELVLADAGASLPVKDSLDTRIINEVRTGTATYGGVWGAGLGIIDSQDEVGGWPELQSQPAPLDSDSDGMSDAWEIAHGLSISDPDDRNDVFDNAGYTNLETYLNELCVRIDFITAPGQLQAFAISTNLIILTWKESSANETGFVIERSTENADNFSEIATVAANDTSFQDDSVTSGVHYFYRVRAINEQTRSFYTNIADAVTTNSDGSSLKAEHPSPADNATDVSVVDTLRWTAGLAATSHNVYFGHVNPPDFQGNFTVSEFNPNGMLDGTTYYWQIDEVNDAGTTTGDLWQFTTEAIAQELIVNLPFNDGSGSFANDQSGNKNYGYLKNMSAANWVDGVAGKALEFDGQDEYVRINYKEIFDFNIGSFTIAFWLKQSNRDLPMPWFSKQPYESDVCESGYAMYHDGTGQVLFRVTDNEISSQVSASDSLFVSGNWEFITAVRNSKTRQLLLYANGELVASAMDSCRNIASNSHLFLGSDAAQQHFFVGAIDEFRVYNYALDQDEIKSLFNTYYTDVSGAPGADRFEFDMHNYPNPFNPATQIMYTVPAFAYVNLAVFNLLGQEIQALVDETKPAGYYSVKFEGLHLNSGIYVIRLRIGDRVLNRKMALVR